jgi:hypothetical protein
VFFHLIFAGWGFVAPVMLRRMTRKGPFRDRAALMVGAVSGAACGAGVALGLFFQSTTASIDSGYSFGAVGRWLTLAATGGAVGLGAGLVLARLARSWRPALALFFVLAVVAAVGWAASAARPEIDCDHNPTFCSERYG